MLDILDGYPGEYPAASQKANFPRSAFAVVSVILILELIALFLADRPGTLLIFGSICANALIVCSILNFSNRNSEP